MRFSDNKNDTYNDKNSKRKIFTAPKSGYFVISTEKITKGLRTISMESRPVLLEHGKTYSFQELKDLLKKNDN